MKNAEGFNVSVVTTGNPIVDTRRQCNLRPVTLESLFVYIDSIVQDARIREEVKLLAGKYPQGSLWAFRKNVRKHIERAQKKVALAPLQQREIGDDSTEKESYRDASPDEFN